ncbi:hypothetical protein Tco_0521006 [Tanacetum coccineum]
MAAHISLAVLQIKTSSWHLQVECFLHACNEYALWALWTFKDCTSHRFTFDLVSRIFESGGSDLNNSKVKDSWDSKNKPDGWETTSKGEEDGNIWEMSQREEDILSKETGRWMKYMIEELGPNAKRGSKGSVSRLPSLADPATQPFTEDKIQIATTNTRGR